MEHPHLTVESKGLFATLRKVFPQLRRRKVLEVILSYDGEHLLVDFQGAQYGAKAVGEWKGSCRVSMKMFEAIAGMHQEDTLEFAYRDGKLKIGRTAVTARWQDIPAKLIEISIDTPEVDFLGICMSAPEARVVSSGLGPRFRDASDRLAKRIDAAADALKGYGEFRTEIEEMVFRDLRRRGRDAG